MANVSKLHILFGLFFVLLIILSIKPQIITNLYSSIFGRLFLILIVLFFSMNNITLGLLTAIIIIISSNMFVIEGMDTMNSTKDNEEEKDITVKDIKNITETPIDLPQLPDVTQGVDIEAIKESIKSIQSNSLPVPPMTSSQEPTPSSKEAFSSMDASV